MPRGDHWIPESDFATCLSHFPQPCVDLVVEHDGGVLLARRTNEPAVGRWFWPGGRLRKGEGLAAASRRVAREELGLAVAVREQLGASEHHWETSAVDGVDRRHTVPVVYRVTPTDGLDVDLDDQHDDWRLLCEPEPGLHEYVRAYLSRFDLPVSAPDHE